jgi:hypothetical protein
VLHEPGETTSTAPPRLHRRGPAQTARARCRDVQHRIGLRAPRVRCEPLVRGAATPQEPGHRRHRIGLRTRLERERTRPTTTRSASVQP